MPEPMPELSSSRRRGSCRGRSCRRRPLSWALPGPELSTLCRCRARLSASIGRGRRGRAGVVHRDTADPNPYPHRAVFELGVEVDARRRRCELHLDLGADAPLDFADEAGVGVRRDHGERGAVAAGWSRCPRRPRRRSASRPARPRRRRSARCGHAVVVAPTLSSASVSSGGEMVGEVAPVPVRRSPRCRVSARSRALSRPESFARTRRSPRRRWRHRRARGRGRRGGRSIGCAWRVSWSGSRRTRPGAPPRFGRREVVRYERKCRARATSRYRTVEFLPTRRTTSRRCTMAGRPSREALYRRLDEAFVELRDRLGGLPDPVEASDIWNRIWHQEAHHSTALEGNTLVLAQVETLLEQGGRSAPRSSASTWRCGATPTPRTGSTARRWRRARGPKVSWSRSPRCGRCTRWRSGPRGTSLRTRARP